MDEEDVEHCAVSPQAQALPRGFELSMTAVSKPGRETVRAQTADKYFSGGLEGPQALQSGFVSPGFAGRAGSLRPWAQTFLKHLAEKAAVGGLFRQTEPGREWQRSIKKYCENTNLCQVNGKYETSM